jgi:hypothetical protein
MVIAYAFCSATSWPALPPAPSKGLTRSLLTSR